MEKVMADIAKGAMKMMTMAKVKVAVVVLVVGAVLAIGLAAAEVAGVRPQAQPKVVQAQDSRSVSGQPSDEIVAFLTAANSANQALIKSGSGSAQLLFRREIGPVPPDNPDLNNPGIERRSIQWYFSGVKRRVDAKSLDLSPGEVRFNKIAVNVKEAWDDKQFIYVQDYGKNQLTAYINKPMGEAFRFVRNATQYFDPMLFAQAVDDWALRQWIDDAIERRLPISVKKSGESGHEVYRIVADGDAVLPNGPSGKRERLEVEVAADVGYNITRLKRFVGDLLMTDFEGTYTDGGTGGKCYFPQSYRLRFDGIRGATDVVEVTFSDVSLNQPIDDAVFHFASMGIPIGTRLRDMRGGEALGLYYSGVAEQDEWPNAESVKGTDAGTTKQTPDQKAPIQGGK